MTSVLRVSPNPTQYYVAVSSPNEAVNRYVWNGSAWTSQSRTPVTSGNREIYKDLGMTVFYSSDAGAPPVDLRKVALVNTNGIDVDTVMYIPLGTRLRGTDTQQRQQYDSCWVALMAAGVAERQFGLRS